MADAQLSVELRAQVSQYINGIRNASGETQKAESNIYKASSAIGGYIAGAFSVGAIISFGKAVIDATAEYQKFGAVLGNTLGSSALANLKLKELQDFAAKTPFSVNELTASYVKLANAGFKPTGDQLTKLGDLASSTGKTFDELAEAILDAQSGEFERLKEFGIRAKDAGDSVIFTYKGVQTQVDKTAGSIREYITSLGGAEGVSGSMAVISETLGGKISNLGDSWDQMLISVGKNTEGVFSESIGIISASINKITEFNRELEIASKYKINGGLKDVFETLYKYSAGGLAGGAQSTTKEKSVGLIASAQDDVASFVSEAITGAKTAADFGKALADLKNKGDALLGKTKNSQVLKGISDAYQQGVTAIIDARRNFNKEATASDGNFGKAGGKGKTIKSVADILKELDTNLRVTENQFGATFDEKTEGAIKNYQTAINDLAKKGTPDAIAAIGQLNAVLKQTQQLGQNISFSGSILGATTNGGDASSQYNSFGGKGSSGIEVVDPTLNAFKKVEAARQKLLQGQQEFNAQFQGLVVDGLTNALSGVGESIGEALANGGSVLDAVGKSLLGSFGSFLSEYGRLLTAYGVAALVKGKLDASSLVPGAGLVTGPLAIAAGIALQAAGAAIGAFASGKGKSADGTGSNVTAFADGGIVSGPTLGLIGEYPGAKSDPEVVAPLSKLKDIIGKGSANNPNGSAIVMDHEIVLKGKDLALIIKRANDSRT